MNEDLHFARQFLLTKATDFPFAHWLKKQIGDLTLFYHPLLKIQKGEKEDCELLLVGYAFDPENPNHDNADIVKALMNLTGSLEKILKKTDGYTGQFVIIYREKEKLYIFNDACAQREVYYTSDFSHFGSQVNLLEQVVHLDEHSDKEAKEFYQSNIFNKKKVFIGAETHKKNVKHLRPNHYLDLTNKRTVRFFPTYNLEQNNLNKVAETAASQLQKILKAVAYRYQLALPVTAGYDSRMLFGASLEIDCQYFIFKHRKLHDKHPDIVIPQNLLQRFKKKLNIITYSQEVPPDLVEVHRNSIDFYRPDNTGTIFNGYRHFFRDKLVLNGNLSEIAKNYFGNFKNIKAEELAFFSGVEAFPYAVNLYKGWLKENNTVFSEKGYHLLDMFYWEEKMGNWGAKGKTEAQLGTEFFSPFNSRNFIALLLSVDRKYRDTQNNFLFNEILKKLSPGLLEEPINPDRKTRAIKSLKRIGIYDLYRSLALKFRLLKF